MRHFKHYCKIIFSTMAVVLVFACHSLVAHADPLTGALIGSALASGFSFPGFAGLSVPSSESIVGDFFVDLVPWSTLVQAGHAYLTIRDLVGSNNVEVELSPELSIAGYDRTNQLNSHYSLTPGTVHSFGSYTAVGPYVFSNFLSSQGFYYGPSLGSMPASFEVGYSHNFTVASGINLYAAVLSNYSSKFQFQSFIGNYSSSLSVSTCPVSSLIYFTYAPTSGSSGDLAFKYHHPTAGWVNLNPPKSLYTTGVSLSTSNPELDRDSSEIVDPVDRANKIVIPASYVQDITYISGSVIDTEEIVEKVLDSISKAGFDGNVVSSEYSDVPVPGTTISETAYSVLNDTFSEFKEFFGDIYDGITSFHESFGDWVDNIASGWTEVFGDIFSDLHDFKEAFGDWVDDVASGWTEVFGDIYSTVSGIASTVSGTISSTLSTIASGVQSLVQSIENADFEFIDAFWKNFLTPFNNLFNTIKSHLSIWHYVVEWLASISSVFTFYLGVFSGAGSGFLLPIYACFAGTVVIAVYKRFGK